MCIKRLSVVITGLSLLLAVSCGKNSDSNDGKALENETNVNLETSSVDSDSTAPTLQQFKIERAYPLEPHKRNIEEYKKEINTWLVRFVMDKKVSEAARLECNKLIFNQRTNLSEAAFDLNGEAVIVARLLNSDPNEVEYECQVIEKGRMIVSKNFNIRKSLVITGRKKFSTIGLSEKDKIETLVLDLESKLYIEDQKIDLELNEIVSLGGTITTFLEEDAINRYNNTIGHNGGDLKIKTKTARGQINIVLRGMDGGRQTSIPPEKTSRLPRDPSLDGKCSKSSKSGPDYSNTRCYGKKGHTGEKGKIGEPGFPGGDSGTLNLVIENSNDFEINLTYLPGQGSSGGKGGKGGFGSPGGNGSTVRWTTYGGCGREGPCNAIDHQYTFPNGAKGDRGPDGDRGDEGAPGKIMPSEITIGTETTVIENDWNN